MIPNATSVAEVESTFAGEDVDMEIDQNSLAHLMGVLSDIYKDPTAAVVREYTVNAIDSHVDANNPDPVRITLPNAFAPNLVIQDFGIGMDADDVREVYSKYGASTKRLSDTVSGMLGIGAKSAFAYSNGFLVTAVKNGKRIHVSVNRSEDGGGVMTILNESDTKEPNGVTISIPVRDSYEMKNAVQTFCSYLEPGKVLVDGKDLSQRDEWELITSDVRDADGNVAIKNLYRVPNTSLSKVIMGNVPYDPRTQISPMSGVAVYAEVRMGAVAFEPSREALKDSALTRATETLIIDTYRDILTEQISQEIAAAPNKVAARKAMNALKGKMMEVGITSLKYKDEEVPSSTKVAIQVKEGEKSIVHANMSRSYGYFNPRRTFDFDSIDSVKLVVTGAPEHNRPGPVFRERIANYLKRVYDIEASWGYVSVLLLSKGQESYLKHEWFDLSDITVPWATLRQEHVDRTRIGGGGVKTAGKHFVINEHGVGELTEVDEEEEILYVTASEICKDWDLKRFTGYQRPRSYAPYDKSAYKAFMKLVRTVVDDDTLILDVYGNRLDKFKRDYPDAKPLTIDAVRGKIEALITDSVTDADILASLYLSNISDDLLRLLPDTDPDVQILQSVGEHDGNVRDARQKVSLATGLANDDFNERHAEVVEKVKSALEAVQSRYPLLAVLNRHIYNDEHREIVRKHLAMSLTESQEDNNDAV